MKPFQQRQEVQHTIYRLEKLRELVDGNPSTHAIADASAGLETLLVNTNGPCLIQRAWTHLGFPKSPIIETNTVNAPTAIFTINGVRSEARNDGYAALAPSVQGSQSLIQLSLDQGAFMRSPRVGATASRNTLKLPKFMDSAGLVIRGTYIKRRESIDFIRNKRGGAHPHNWKNTNKNEMHNIIASIYDPTEQMLGGETITVETKIERNLNIVDNYIINIIIDTLSSSDIQIMISKAKKM